MKKQLYLIGLLMFSIGLFGQGTITLSSTRTVGGTETACQQISLKPGFSFKATATSSLTLLVDKVACTSYNNVSSVPSLNQNYILTRTYQSNDATFFTDQIQYYDGLGRPIQTVQAGATLGKKDLVSIQTYDAFGREDESWLPGLSSGNGAFVAEATVKTNAIAANLNDQKPFSKVIYEASPLNRVTAQYGPGADWHKTYASDSKAIRTAYKTNVAGNNTLNCRLYKASGTNQNPTLSTAGNYATGELFVTELQDENGNLSYTFKDKLEQVVLTRQISAGINHDTYYVYNDFGNLCYVLPPLLADNGTNAAERDKYAYQYQYDDHNRCIYKKLPGCEPIYYIYDKADRLIFTQDGEQRVRNAAEWTFTIPDVFGRVTVSGICYNTMDYKADYLKNAVALATPNRSDTKFKGYTISGLTPGGVPVILSVNYYDNYSFMGVNGIPSENDAHAKYEAISGYGSRYTASAKGLLTGTLTAQLLPDGKVGDTYLYSVMYYDERERVVQTKSNNHLAGGMEKEYWAYNFTGQPVKRMHVHSATGKSTQTETYTYNYDHAGRLIETWHKLGAATGNGVLIAKNEYDDMGRLKSLSKGNNRAELKTTYTYNIRSWMKSISSPLFKQTLYYQDTDWEPQYNGNIAGITWENGSINIASSSSFYEFSYDQLSRLTKAVFSYGELYSASYAYDKHGNITRIRRRGGYYPGLTGDFADDVTLTYSGNKLTKADDAGRPIIQAEYADFKDYANVPIEYTYNRNGSMTKDLNKGIEQIQYNSLNLPREMLIKNPDAKAKNYYTYSASGMKLRTEQRYDATQNANPILTTNPTNDGLKDYKITEYVGNIIYETSKILTSPVRNKTRILIDGGYIEGGEYYYYMTDHLGNNRVVADSYGRDNQRTDYFPFGMVIPTIDNPEKQPYKYNGKELDAMHGLNIYDFSARHYDPAIARFTSVDPLAEK